MEKEQKPKEQAANETQPSAAKEGIAMKKILMIGAPVFILQVVVIYFLMATFILPLAVNQPESEQQYNEEGNSNEEEEKKIYVAPDIIVNPAGTNGTRFLLTSIGFEVRSPELLKELEGKEIQVRDVLNTVLTSKRLDELVNASKREILREEIAIEVNKLLHNGDLEKVYFSKFIIQ